METEPGIISSGIEAEVQISQEVRLVNSLLSRIHSDIEIPDTIGWRYQDEIDKVNLLRANMSDLVFADTDRQRYEATVETIDTLGSAMDETHELAGDFVSDELDTLQTLVNKYDGTGAAELVQTLGYPSSLEEIKFVLNNLPEALKRTNDPGDLTDIIQGMLIDYPSLSPFVMRTIIDTVYEEDEQVSKTGTEILAGAIYQLNSPDSKYKFANVGSSELHELLMRLPEGREYFSDELISIWMLGTDDKEVSTSSQAWYQFNSMVELLRIDPKIPGFLAHEFGINRIGRYPIDALVTQYNEAEEREKPYVLVAATRRDHNGAYSFSAKGHVFEKLFNKTKELDMALRFIEVGSDEEIDEMTNFLLQKYGEAELGILYAHANENLIDLDDRDNSVVNIDGEMDSLKSLARVIKRGGHMIFSSCWVGVQGSFAEKLAMEGIITHGPSDRTSLIDVELDRKDKLEVTPHYRKPTHLRTYYPPEDQ